MDTYVGHIKSTAHYACVANRIMKHSDFRNSCEPDFCKEHCMHIGRLCGPCCAKQSLDMEEETDESDLVQ
jgi:hypothetical protein